mgnify:FL=1
MFRSFFKKAMERMPTQGYRRAVQTGHLKKKDTTAYFLVNRNIIFWYTENQIEM